MFPVTLAGTAYRNWPAILAGQLAVRSTGRSTSTARRQYVSGSFRRSAWKNNAFPRAKLARYVRYV